MKTYFNKTTVEQARSYLKDNYETLELNDDTLAQIAQGLGIPPEEAMTSHPKGRNKMYHFIYSNVLYKHFNKIGPAKFLINKKETNKYSFTDWEAAAVFCKAMANAGKSVETISIQSI